MFMSYVELSVDDQSIVHFANEFKYVSYNHLKLEVGGSGHWDDM